MLIPLLIAAAAQAAGVHTGIPVRGVPSLSEPYFDSAARGWTASFPSGLARVYVGRDEAATIAWFIRTAAQMAKHKPEPLDGVGDEALVKDDAFLLTRDGNVGVLIECTAGARARAAQLLAAISDTPSPWPLPPVVRPLTEDRWAVEAPGAEHLSWVGGTRVGWSGLVFSAPPERVVAWDEWGRAAVQRLDATGAPLPPTGPAAEDTQR